MFPVWDSHLNPSKSWECAIFLYNYNKSMRLGVTYNSNAYPKNIQFTKNYKTHDDLQDDVEKYVHEVTMEHNIQRMRPPIVKAPHLDNLDFFLLQLNFCCHME